MLSTPADLVSPDLRAALIALGPQRRDALGRSIGVDVQKALAKKIDPWFSRGMQDHADVDVFAAERREARVVLHFIADHFNYNSAQSGSDWADHYLFAGEAELDGSVLGRVTFALEREVHITEHQNEHYDTRLIRDLVRDEFRARQAGAPIASSAFDSAVSAVRAASDARAAAARAASRSRSEAAVVVASPTMRCPKCASRQVQTTALFDAYELRCKDCGCSEIFVTWPEQDSDVDWSA